MSTTIVHTAIRRSNLRMLLGSAVVAVIVLALLALNVRYFKNFVQGPTPIANDQLLALTDPATLDRYWRDVQGDDVIDTGAQYIRTDDRGRETVEATYPALIIGDRLLLVKTPNSTALTTYSGALVAIPDDVQREIIDDLESLEPDLKGVFLPYMLDATSFRANGYIGLGIAIPLLLLCAVGLVLAARRSQEPETHPIMRRLATYGMADDMARQIEHELLMPRATRHNVRITERWVVYSKGATFDAMRLQDVLWVYKHVTKTKYYGVITVAKHYAVHLHDRHGRVMKIALRKEARTNEVLEMIMAAAPWVIAGFDSNIEQAWKKQRPELIAAVEQRRQQAISSPSASSDAAAGLPIRTASAFVR